MWQQYMLWYVYFQRGKEARWSSRAVQSRPQQARLPEDCLPWQSIRDHHSRGRQWLSKIFWLWILQEQSKLSKLIFEITLQIKKTRQQEHTSISLIYICQINNFSSCFFKKDCDNHIPFSYSKKVKHGNFPSEHWNEALILTRLFS